MGRGGIEPPTHGFSVRCRKNITADKRKTCEIPKEQLTPKSQNQAKIDTQKLPADLAKVVAAWPEVPEHIKTAIKSLLQIHIQGGK